MDSINSFIKKFDYFGYNPKFRMNGNNVYKSFLEILIFNEISDLFHILHVNPTPYFFSKHRYC